MELFNDWLWWIFDHLPFTHVVRILDCYLVEGYKIFYRIAFALLRTFVKYIRSGNSKWNGMIDSRGVKEAFIYFCKEIPVNSIIFPILIQFIFNVFCVEIGVSRKFSAERFQNSWIQQGQY